MAENKTKQTEASVDSYFANIDNVGRRQDCECLGTLMAKATGFPPKMWGSSIVGFGAYHYRYESGREGDSCLVGFASRASDIAIYGLNAATNRDELLVKLGRHKAGKGCLYIRALDDIDLNVLERLIGEAATAKAREHC